MPNWCCTFINFVGSPADIKDLYKRINIYTSKNYAKSDFGVNWLGNILYGFDLADAIDSNDPSVRLRCRGSIQCIGEIKTENSQKHFAICTLTAHVPMIRMWLAIIKKHYDNRIDIFWIAEEEYNNVYDTNSIEHYIDEHYRLNWEISVSERCVSDTMYTGDVQAVINAVNELVDEHHIKANYVTPYDIEQAEKAECYWELPLADTENRVIKISCTILREINSADCD